MSYLPSEARNGYHYRPRLSSAAATQNGNRWVHRDLPVVKLKVISTRRLREQYNPRLVRSRYCQLYRRKTDRHWLHRKLVTHARQHGPKDAARGLRHEDRVEVVSRIARSRRGEYEVGWIARVCDFWGRSFPSRRRNVSIFISDPFLFLNLPAGAEICD